MTARRSVLVTGAAGSIGTTFLRAAADDYALTLVDLPGTLVKEHALRGRVIEADVSDLESLGGLFQGIDTVVHLAGERSPSTPWKDLLPANIVGTYNVVVAAAASGVERIVYASSVHAVTGYPLGTQVREGDPVRPDDLYGVTKCFGEALGAFAVTSGAVPSFVALRIGAFQPASRLADPDAGWMLRDYCSPEDLVALVRTIVDSDHRGFDIFNAASANTFGRLDMTKARRELGFVPRSDAFELAPAFAQAIAAVGGLDDRPAQSGMRDDLSKLRGV